MEFNKIIAVTGKSGLYQVISQSKNAIIAEAIEDKKKIAINAAQNVSLLENIAIYTYEEDLPLLDVFKKISKKADGKNILSHKESANKLTTFFAGVVPNYDVERVYTSNIKKVVQWYNLLIKVGFDFTTIKKTEAVEETK